MKKTTWILGAAVYFFLSTGEMVQGASLARTQPPFENLIQAKSVVLGIKARVSLLIQKIAFGGGGGGGGGSDSCHRFMTKRKCLAAGCFWGGNTCSSSAMPPPDGTYPGGGPLDSLPDEGEEHGVLENDVAANFALQGMGAGLDQLASDIDQAAMAFNQPGFWIYWGQACGRANSLLGANQAGKVAANIPPPGFVTSADFIPIDIELMQVKGLLLCP